MARLIETRGPKRGQCNICGAIGDLTEDHTPPKGCLRPTRVEMLHIWQRLSNTENVSTKGRLSQNGVKFRTICGRCNSTMLGARYDPSLISFVNAVAQVLRTSLTLPPMLLIRAQPQAILRSLFGHLSAQGVHRYLKGPLTEPMRDYFLNTEKPLPLGVRAYYWAHPHQQHVMMRDASYLDIPRHTPFVFWLLKFFPVAFMLAWDEPAWLPDSVLSFERWRDVPFDSEVDMPIRTHEFPHVFWPEAPTEQSLILCGEQAMFVRNP